MARQIAPELLQLKEAIEEICDGFDDNYWLACDRQHRFPDEFRDAMAKAGWLGITMPEEYGGAGLGITEAALMMHTVGIPPACLPRVRLFM